ncbi:MAG: glycosyltransferase family 4 protein [Vulcanimicrobiaceae bacterium]
MVVPEYPPLVIGGGGAAYKRVAEYLRGRGHRVLVVRGDFADREGEQPNVTPGCSSEIVVLPTLRTPRFAPWLTSVMPPTLSGLRILKGIISQDWDVAHLHGAGFPLIDFAAGLLRLQKIPYVFTIHGIPNSPLHRGPALAIALRMYLHVATRATARHAHIVTTVSNALRTDRLFPARDAKVIYNGVDSEALTTQRPCVPRPEEPLRLISLSRLSRNKGIDVAVEAVALANRDKLNVVYDIFGPDGGEGTAIRSQIARLDRLNAIRICGTFSPSERGAILQQYHGLLMPSRVEGFGLAALEGLAAGLPVIASRVDGLTEFLNDQNAFLLEPGRPEALRDSMLLLRDADRVTSRVSEAQKTVHRFSWGASLSQYEQALESAGRARPAQFGRRAGARHGQ